MFSPLGFQITAVEKLTASFIKLWGLPLKQLPLVFKSPTGSGKTLMMANFVNGLNHLPNWDGDKAFIWITFSDDLAMQSRDKFSQYFGTVLENGLLTVADLDRGLLQRNDILFLNWQKVVSKAATNRILRRPEDLRFKKESGLYFEDFIDGTKANNREIILIIDEAHTNVTPDLAQEIIDYIDPKVVVHVSATPKPEMVAAAAEIESFVQVGREAVIAEGLIKSQIITQTHEDLSGTKASDLDHVLLEIGLAKREEILVEYKRLNKNINPLLLVQLPNDDSDSVGLGEKSKQQIVLEYLEQNGYDLRRVARWFDDNPKPRYLEENDSEYDILLFKMAAGTGWDCPRAQVLVMYRNIRVEARFIQTVGRILRMPEPNKSEDYFGNILLNTGFLYTNYDRRDIVSNWLESTNNQPHTKIAYRKLSISNVSLPTDTLLRVDYGDLSNSAKFQQSLAVSLNDYFGITDIATTEEVGQALESKGINLAAKVTNKLIVDGQINNFDLLALQFQNLGHDEEVDLSKNDVEKTFNYYCWRLLGEQTEDEAKISNVSRSWSPFKSALRVWFRSAISMDSDYYYRVFIADIDKGASSVFRPAITQALKNYRPILNELVQTKLLEQGKKFDKSFTVQEFYTYPDSYSSYEVKLCALEPFFLPKDNYPGKPNEVEFIEFLEQQSSRIEWWLKQGIGQEYLGIKYLNTATQKNALFFPDWILKMQDGRTGIIDTKSGSTASHTEGRAEALVGRISDFVGEVFAGIAVKENAIWYLNSSPKYEYTSGKLSADWVPLVDLLKKTK
jgi:type III restriction enzyme